VGGVDHPEASDAIICGSQNARITRGRYVQLAIWAAISPTDKEMDLLIPIPRQTTNGSKHLANPKSGHIGRWSMWVRARCTIHNSVPIACSRC